MEAARVVEAGDVEQARGHGEVGGQMARKPEAEHHTRRGLLHYSFHTEEHALNSRGIYVMGANFVLNNRSHF